MLAFYGCSLVDENEFYIIADYQNDEQMSNYTLCLGSFPLSNWFVITCIGMIQHDDFGRASWIQVGTLWSNHILPTKPR